MRVNSWLLRRYESMCRLRICQCLLGTRPHGPGVPVLGAAQRPPPTPELGSDEHPEMERTISSPKRLTKPYPAIRAARDAAIGLKPSDDGRLVIGPQRG